MKGRAPRLTATLTLIAAMASEARAQTQKGPQQEAPPSATVAAASEAKPSPTEPQKPVVSKWSTELYGFVELDSIEDSTQSLNDAAGNARLSRPEAFGGQHPRFTMSARHTRLGWRFSSPEYHGIVAKGLIESDFFGNEPSIASSSEVSFLANPDFRIRHAWLKLENLYVEALVGQTWQLFGWQPYFHPNTVAVQGIPGEVFARTPQVRLSHSFKRSWMEVEVAVAASRSAQRDSGVPDGQAGLRVVLPGWKGLHTIGGSATSVDAASVGVSGILRRFVAGAPGSNADPSVVFATTGGGYSLDAFIPVIPVTGSDRSNALTVNGSFTRGDGIADNYTGLTFGLPAVTVGSYVDPGLVVQSPSGALDAIKTRSFVVGAQYYFPRGGDVWLSANFTHLDFINADAVAMLVPNGTTSVFKRSTWFDVNLFWDVTTAVRLGFEYARFEQTFVDGLKAHNNRYQLSGWYLF